MNKKYLLIPILALILASCGNTSTSSDSLISSSENSSEVTSESTSEDLIEEPMREARNLSLEPDVPSNIVTEDLFAPVAADQIVIDGSNIHFKSGQFGLNFIENAGTYHIELTQEQQENVKMFQIIKPVKIYFRTTGGGQTESNYTSVEVKSYGLVASATVVSKNGSSLLVEDYYYLPKDAGTGVFNVQRSITVTEAALSDSGYQSIFSVLTDDNQTNTEFDWFVPNSVFGDFPSVFEAQPYKLFRETLLGLPMAMMRHKTNGHTISLARYQPVIDYSTNSFASISIHRDQSSSNTPHSSIEVTYPTRDTARRYFSLQEQKTTVYDLTIQVSKTESFQAAMIDTYTNQFTLQDQRIVDTDIDEVYNVINEDFKTFMLSTEARGMTSYGLPWRVTLDTGKIGPKSYQAGFVGQQIPAAYHMMLYGLRNDDAESLQNGINIINFWVNSANMMTPSGVPKIWFNGDNNTWAGYPTFTRMAVDAMEGLLDAYRLAEAYEIETSGWIEAVTACADFFAREQNSDGSWYRCYNYQGSYYRGDEGDIPWNPGAIAQSTSKNNTTMPLRFLGKMYEMTAKQTYFDAIVDAGEFIYSELYSQHAYFGGTADNPDAMDKEAGVFAMYAFDTLLTLTGDSKWLECLKQATIFTMSSVLTVSFKIMPNATDLNAANGVKYGYTDGLSYITCNGTGLDNYAAYIYYQLFRLYIHSNEKVYLDMAEFIQQNTKSTMNWDDTLGYAYKSLVPEASTIYSFGFGSATDDEGVQGVWLPWASVANAEPIAKMYDNFGDADVVFATEIEHSQLVEMLETFGVGGHPHRVL